MRNQNLTLFIDTSNLLQGSQRKHKRRVDYKKLLTQVEKLGNVRGAFAYGSVGKKDEAFCAMLRGLGFEIRWSKTNSNVSITLDVVRNIEKSDLIVVCSGDPALSALAEWVCHQGVKYYAFGCHISDAVRQAADRFFEIEEDVLADPKIA